MGERGCIFLVVYVRPGLLEMDLKMRVHVHMTYLKTCSQGRQVRKEKAGQPKESAEIRFQGRLQPQPDPAGELRNFSSLGMEAKF